MRDADEAFVWELVDNDPVAYERANRMPTREMLPMVIGYLRRVKQAEQARKPHGRGHRN
jgi:hypothetical protein